MSNAQHPQDATPTGVGMMVRNGEPPTAVAPLTRPLALLRPIASPQEVLAVQEETRSVVTEMLQEGRDYGTIPGVNKPSLFKPGAERVSIAFGLVPRYRIIEKEIDHDRVVPWRKSKRGDETSGESLGLYRYVVECQLVHRESGAVVGDCIGVCSTMESKYIDRPRDSENTVLKMAQKRAHVGATLNAVGLSEQFTQDVEDTGAASDTTGSVATNEPMPSCPKCGGRMWDNRKGKTNPKAPDFKCRDRNCDGVIWPGQWPPKPDAKPEGEQRADPTTARDANSRTTQESATQPASASTTPTSSGSKGSGAPSRYVTRMPLDPFKGERLDATTGDGESFVVDDEAIDTAGRWAYTAAQAQGTSATKQKKLLQLATDCDAELKRRALGDDAHTPGQRAAAAAVEATG